MNLRTLRASLSRRAAAVGVILVVSAFAPALAFGSEPSGSLPRASANGDESSAASDRLAVDPTPPVSASVTIVTLVDADGDASTVDDQVPAPQWELTVATETGEEQVGVSGTDPLGEVTFEVPAAFDGSTLSITQSTRSDGSVLVGASCLLVTSGGAEDVPPLERAAAGLSIPIDPGADYVCTFVNAAAPGDPEDDEATIRIAKWIDLDGQLKNDANQHLAGGWEFAIYAEADVGFTVVTESDEDSEDFGAVDVVIPVTGDAPALRLQEFQQDGFTLVDVLCAITIENGPYTFITVERDGDTVSFPIDAANDYACAFVNQPDAPAPTTAPSQSPAVTLPPTDSPPEEGALRSSEAWRSMLGVTGAVLWMAVVLMLVGNRARQRR